MTIIVVAVVAIIIIAAAAFFLMNQKNYNAQELALKFVDDYDGEFGEFTIATGGTEGLASLSYTTKCMLADGTVQKNKDGTDKTRDVNFQIYHYDSKDVAAEAFEDFIINSKNGSKGETLLTQTDKLGMATGFITILDGSKDLAPETIADNTTYKGVKASTYGCDQLYIMYASYSSATSAEFTQAAGAILDGCNVIVFNQTTLFDLYYNVPIKDTVGSRSITASEFENELMKFAKAF